MRLMVTLGLGEVNYPSNMEGSVFIGEYIEKFGNFKLLDMTHAFDLILSGKMKHELNLFDKPFSIRYISEVMRKYEEFRRTSAMYRALCNTNEVEGEDTEDIIFNRMNRYIGETFKLAIAGKMTMRDVTTADYNHIKNKHKLFEVTEEEIAEAKEYGVMLLNKDLARSSSLFDIAKGNIKKAQIDKHTSLAIKSKAQCVLVYRYLHRLAKAGGELVMPPYNEWIKSNKK